MTWKIVKQAPNYEVNEQGVVKNRDTGFYLTPYRQNGRDMLVLMHRGNRVYAAPHHLVYEHFVGEREIGESIMFKNGDKKDIRPDNLYSGGKGGSHHRQQTHCKRGHEFCEGNTNRRVDKPTYRQCRACFLALMRLYPALCSEPEIQELADYIYVTELGFTLA